MNVQSVTETELAVLQCLWSRGQATSREVAQSLYDDVSDPKLASAQKLLQRLEFKNCVSRDRSERPHVFRAKLSREQFTGHRVQALADKLYGGSLTPILTSLVESGDVSKEELADLRNLIDQLSRKRPRRESRKK